MTASEGTNAVNGNRSRDAERTRAAILAAACLVFGERGYGNAGVREIAARAGINASLVVRYFGSKEALFEQVLLKLLDVDALTSAKRESFGQHVSRLLGGGSPEAPNPLSVMILASGDPVAREIALRLLEAQIIRPLARWLGGRRSHERAARITMLCSGYLTYSVLLPLPGTSRAASGPTRSWLARSLQQIVDDDGG